MSLLSEAWAMKDQIQVPTKPKLKKVGKKDGVWRSESYRRLVASVPCVAPGCGRSSQACHRNEGKGGAIKAPDGMLFAACPDHHAAIDAQNKQAKADRRALEDSMIVRTWDYLISHGLIAMVEE